MFIINYNFMGAVGSLFTITQGLYQYEYGYTNVRFCMYKTYEVCIGRSYFELPKKNSNVRQKIEKVYKEELNYINDVLQSVSGVKLSEITGWSIRKGQRVKENFAIGYLSNWESKNTCYKGKWHKFFKEITFKQYLELKELFNYSRVQLEFD
jgi:hypothetical protein